jgi:hypothetical protein
VNLYDLLFLSNNDKKLVIVDRNNCLIAQGKAKHLFTMLGHNIIKSKITKISKDKKLISINLEINY